MIQFLTSTLQSSRRDHLLILSLVLGFLIMVGGSWLNGRQSGSVSADPVREQVRPAQDDLVPEADLRQYATLP